MPVAYFCPWRPPKQRVSGAVSERDDHVSRRKGRWFESNRGSQLRTLICIPRKLAFFYAFFRYFMQNWHKSRHFGQKFRLYMRIFSVVEVESTFLTLFFVKNRDTFLFSLLLQRTQKRLRVLDSNKICASNYFSL
jgi:hypothetical protein